MGSIILGSSNSLSQPPNLSTPLPFLLLHAHDLIAFVSLGVQRGVFANSTEVNPKPEILHTKPQTEAFSPIALKHLEAVEALQAHIHSLQNPSITSERRERERQRDFIRSKDTVHTHSLQGSINHR